MTPLRQQYLRIKKQFPDTIVMFRLGDFYESFDDDAKQGVGGQRFLRAMRDASNIQFILDDARRNGYPPSQQRAFVMAKVLEQARVVIVGSQCPELVRDCKMVPAPTIGQALKIAQRDLGGKPGRADRAARIVDAAGHRAMISEIAL